jgi:protein-tyrosine-phosphatase
MAEGLCRELRGDVIEAHSAGIEAHGLNPHAVRVMGEIGIDISGQRSKTVGEVADVVFDYVVTVCGHANETCPIFPGRARVIHRGFDDPPVFEWEIEESLKRGKHVIGVYPEDPKPGKFPDAISQNRIKCVPWSKLADTIDGLDQRDILVDQPAVAVFSVALESDVSTFLSILKRSASHLFMAVSFSSSYSYRL